MSEKHDVEAQYDEHIAPLIDRTIEECERLGIPMFATFQMNAAEPSLWCTTSIPTEWCDKKRLRAHIQMARGPVTKP